MAQGRRAREDAAAVKRQKALDLRVAGLHYRQIGEQLGVSHTQAFRYVQRALGDLDAVTKKTAERLRDLEVRRCDRITAAMWPKAKAGDWQAARTILHAVEQRSKLQGTYAPERVLHAGMVITSEQLAGSRDSLGAKLEELHQRMLSDTGMAGEPLMLPATASPSEVEHMPIGRVR